jgi:undecaprenyl-diphosphatase
MKTWAIDMHVMTWVSHHRSPFLDNFFSVTTWAGSLFLLLPLSILLTGYLLVSGKKEAIWLVGFGFGGTILITHLLKALIRRPRPNLLSPIIPVPADFSFPSAHTSQITAFCLCLMLIFGCNRLPWGEWPLSFTMVILIGCVAYSRLYLQVHFASDVAGGIMLAVLWMSVTAFILHRG